MASIARTAATGGDLDPEFLTWSSSLPVDRRLLQQDCQGSIAHVKGLVAAGLLANDEADVLVRALSTLPERIARGEVELPEEEDVHMAVEAWLRQEVGPVADKLHTGRSRNDQVALDLKLWSRGAVGRVRKAIEALLGSIEAWSARHGQQPMPAYTHRQVAIPTLGRLWIDAALTQGLRRDQALLSAVEEELRVSPLGAGAVGGSTLPIDPAMTATELGFSSGPQNPIDAVGERDHALTLVFVCARIGLHLGRFCADVIEMKSDGLCGLGGAVACGSSMMPHKRNPDLFELVRGQAALRQGELAALMSTFHGLGSGYHRDLQQDKEVLFTAVDGVCDSLRMITLGVQELSLDSQACLRALREGDAVATDLTELLVSDGTPFREAYRKVGELVATQRAAGRRLVDLTAEDLRRAGLPESLLGGLDPAESARKRARGFPGA